jgi:hypothetical protein
MKYHFTGKYSNSLELLIRKAYIISLVFSFEIVQAQTTDDVKFDFHGKLKPRPASEIQSSNISVGAEMMDRDYTIYKNWKEYLGPLGVKKARIQSGWAKCEKVQGVYNWAWLDEIIYDMAAQGVEPWIDLCYGNPVYPGGGGFTLKNKHLPSSQEALKAWENYVRAIVTRYKDYVDEWEIWNEPNYEIQPEQFARFSVLTAKAIKSVQPGATVIGLALGSQVNFKYADQVFGEIQNLDGIKYIDQVVHHRHITVPEEDEPEAELERVMDKYSSRIVIRQGEAGCPSQKSEMFAMKGQDWNELQQAKHILRRLMLDLARGKETSIFTIIDAWYDVGGERVWNYKGLLASNENLEVTRVKPAYYALQNATSVFDSSLKPISRFSYEATNDTNLFVFLYENIYTRKQAVVLWYGNRKPSLSLEKQKTDIVVYGGNFDSPALVDLRTGEVLTIHDSIWKKNGNTYLFSDIPVYDSPVLVIDLSLITLDPEKK